MNTRTSNVRLFVRAVVLWGAITSCAFVRGDALTAEQRELRLKEIALKPEADRARLQRNFDTFRALPAAEQERLRLLDMELKEDARNQGHLRQIMDEYYNWLATLTPGQRDDLRRETDPSRREKLVRTYLKEQQDQADITSPAKGAKAPKGLSAKDLDGVLGVIEDAMRKRQMLSPSEIAQLEKKQGLARHTAILDLAFRPGLGGRQGQPPVWTSKEVIDAMVQMISNEGQARQLKVQVARDQPGERWRRLFLLIYQGVRFEYDQKKPDQAALEAFFVQLNSTEQDEIMRLPFDRQQEQLMHVYLTKMSEADPDNYPKPPQIPFWLRRPAGVRPGVMQRPAEADQPRKPGKDAKKNINDRKKSKDSDQA